MLRKVGRYIEIVEKVFFISYNINVLNKPIVTHLIMI